MRPGINHLLLSWDLEAGAVETGAMHPVLAALTKPHIGQPLQSPCLVVVLIPCGAHSLCTCPLGVKPSTLCCAVPKLARADWSAGATRGRHSVVGFDDHLYVCTNARSQWHKRTHRDAHLLCVGAQVWAFGEGCRAVLAGVVEQLP